MEVVLDWRGISVLVTVAIAWSGLLVGSIKWLIDRYSRHIDQRFEGLERSSSKEREKLDAVDKEILRLRAELPNEYVRREDWIRFSAGVDAKLDRLYDRVELLGRSIARMPCMSGECALNDDSRRV